MVMLVGPFSFSTTGLVAPESMPPTEYIGVVEPHHVPNPPPPPPQETATTATTPDTIRPINTFRTVFMSIPLRSVCHANGMAVVSQPDVLTETRRDYSASTAAAYLRSVTRAPRGEVH